MSKKRQCEVCNNEPVVGVYCVPSVPYSAAYGRACLEANAHPWHILVANTACIGGLKNAHVFWKDMVKDTCTHLGKSMEEFEKNVEKSLKI